VLAGADPELREDLVQVVFDGAPENGNVFDFQLSAQDLTDLDELDRTGGTDVALEHKWW
jgi:hypothetical protein